MLVVLQTEKVHTQVEKLLEQLRDTKAEIEADAEKANQDGHRHGGGF